MFDEGNVFGQETPFQETPTATGEPALPAMNGASDGTGAYAQPIEQPAAPPQQAPAPGVPPGAMVMPMDPQMGPMAGPMDGTIPFIEPADASPAAATRTAGFTALFATAAIGAGIATGGAWGAGAGLLLAGSAANAYRAQKWWGSPDASEKHEAVVSAIFSALGVGVGGYMAYKAVQARKEE